MAIYNERLVKVYDEQTYNSLLSNSSEYISLIQEKMNRFNPNATSRCSRLAKLDALDNYISKCVLENPSKLNRNDILKYRDYLFSLFKSHPLISLDNVLFRSDIVTRLFSTDQIKEITEYKKQTKASIKDIVTRIDKGQQVNKQERDKYLIFLVSQLGNNSENIITMQDNMFGMLLKDPNPKSLVEKEFMFKYVANAVAKECKIPPMAIYITDDELSGKEIDKDLLGGSYGNSSIIIINRKNVINNISNVKNVDPLIKMFQTIAHESRHSYQAYSVANNDVSYSSIEYIREELFKKYLSKNDCSEYDANYSNSEIEHDANLYGWTFVTKILEKFNQNLLTNINSTITNAIQKQYEQYLGYKAYEYKKDEKGNIIRGRSQTKDIYNVHFMDEVIKKHPEELKNYPQLLYFYNQDGSKKDFVSRIKSESNLKDTGVNRTIDSVFQEYYLYDIDKGILDQLSINSLSIEEQFQIISRINKVTLAEVDYLSKTISILYKDNVKAFELVNKQRINRLMQLIEYYNKNTNTLNTLIEEDRKLNNKHAIGFTLDILYKKIAGLQNKIGKTEYLQDTQIYQELTELSEVEYNGPRF